MLLIDRSIKDDDHQGHQMTMDGPTQAMSLIRANSEGLEPDAASQWW